MSSIKNELQKVNFVVSQYIDEREALYSKVISTITEKLKKIIDELSPNFGLVSNTAVKKIIHYSFSPRLKDSESFKEKLIRKNLINEFISLLPNGFDTSNVDIINQVKGKLNQVDDLIGIKILTDLNSDCIRMFELICSSEFKSKARAQDISIVERDLVKQPEQMQNGLDIYKVKCSYKEYQFELQIKSKIISAWGDMEHSIFYKDYAISPVRDSAQKSMNHVGRLLYQIDDFVESIRSANKDYSQNAYALIFLQWFDGAYSEKIKNKLDNISYRIDGISELLYASFQKLESNKDLANRSARWDHFEFIGHDPIISKYISKRNANFDLKILEAIVLSWSLDEAVVITQQDIEVTIKAYLQTLVQSASKFLCERQTAYEMNEMEGLVKEHYELGFKHDCKEGFLLSLNKFNNYLIVRFYIKDLLESKMKEEISEQIIKIIFIEINMGKTMDFVNEITGLANSQISREELKTNFVLLKDAIDPKNKKTQIDLINITQTVINKL